MLCAHEPCKAWKTMRVALQLRLLHGLFYSITIWCGIAKNYGRRPRWPLNLQRGCLLVFLNLEWQSTMQAFASCIVMLVRHCTLPCGLSLCIAMLVHHCDLTSLEWQMALWSVDTWSIWLTHLYEEKWQLVSPQLMSNLSKCVQLHELSSISLTVAILMSILHYCVFNMLTKLFHS
mgnify:CR=1 FL=1